MGTVDIFVTMEVISLFRHPRGKQTPNSRRVISVDFGVAELAIFFPSRHGVISIRTNTNAR